MPETRFETVLQPGDGEAPFFLEVPAEAMAALGERERPPVVATLNGYQYRTTVAKYGDKFYLPVRREIRDAASLRPGISVSVFLELDEAPRIVEVPDDLRRALADDPAAKEIFGRLSYTHRKEYVDWVTGAKRVETRLRRIEKAMAMIKEGKKEP